MQHAFGMAIPETVAEMCRPDRAAVLVYDAQVGILPYIRDEAEVTKRARSVLDAARSAGAPVLYTRHVSLSPSHLGVGALRTAMAWQRLERAEDVRSPFPPDAPQSRLVEALAPVDGEPVFDKLGMSAFVGTPLESALRDRGITTVILLGAVLEIGIEPTARHAADLGFLPVLVEDACGIVELDAAERSWSTLAHTLMTYKAPATEVITALAAS